MPEVGTLEQIFDIALARGEENHRHYLRYRGGTPNAGAGAVPVAAKAAARMRDALTELLAGRKIAGKLHRQLAMVRRPSLQIEVSELGPSQGPEALRSLRRGAYVIRVSDLCHDELHRPFRRGSDRADHAASTSSTCRQHRRLRAPDQPMVGASPAIANAIFRATGRRLRDLPIRIGHLL